MESHPVPLDPARPANPLIERNCPCTRDCPRHGDCFACVANHRENIHISPACVRAQQAQDA